MTVASHPACLRREPVRRMCVRARVSRELVAAALRRVPVRVVLPDGSLLGSRSSALSSEAPTIEIVRPTALFERLAHQAGIGVGDGYLAGDWRAAPGTDLADAIAALLAPLSAPGRGRLGWLQAQLDRTAAVAAVDSDPPVGLQTQYDVFTDLFAGFLDDTMTYSSGLFDTSRRWADQRLEQAQIRKIHAVLDRAGVAPGMDILEIGTGWGALAVEAARRGAHVTTLTLSTDQAGHAQRRVDRFDLAERVDIRLSDYHDVVGTFDAVVSVEMVESVGEARWPAYLFAIDRVLAPGGTAVIQSILTSDESYQAARGGYGWTQKHVAPGARIPSVPALQRVCAEHTQLHVGEVHRFGPHYAETLRRWRRTLNERWPAVARRGFPEMTRRKWEYYFAAREAGLDVGPARCRPVAPTTEHAVTPTTQATT